MQILRLSKTIPLKHGAPEPVYSRCSPIYFATSLCCILCFERKVCVRHAVCACPARRFLICTLGARFCTSSQTHPSLNRRLHLFASELFLPLSFNLEERGISCWRNIRHGGCPEGASPETFWRRLPVAF